MNQYACSKIFLPDKSQKNEDKGDKITTKNVGRIRK